MSYGTRDIMKQKLKLAAGLVFCNLYRLLRVFPNGDPIMGFALPMARKGKWWHSLLFPIVAMASFDLLVGRVGIWTLGTSLTYGLIGLAAWTHFSKKKTVKMKNYVKGSVAGVLAFDLVTGPIMSSFMFGMPFSAALIGQIPFTALHLASATAFTLLLAPVLDPQVAKETSNYTTEFFNRLNQLIGLKLRA